MAKLENEFEEELYEIDDESRILALCEVFEELADIYTSQSKL